MIAVAEAKTIRKEIVRIAADYDIEWKGELENLMEQDSQPIIGQRKTNPTSTKAVSGEEDNEQSDEKEAKLDIDKTIDEASELASQSEEKRMKEKASQRKGEVMDDSDDKVRTEEGDKNRITSEKRGEKRGKELTEAGY